MITTALFTGPELADDPWGTNPDLLRQVHRLEWEDPGPWPVTDDRDRPRWACTPLQVVGPLHFGMSPRQVADALQGERPADRGGYHPFPKGTPWERDGDPEEWRVNEERFDRAGVSAHYWHEVNGPELAAVTVHGRTGPRCCPMASR